MVARRIYGQCNTADFRHLEHLADWMAQGKEVDVTNFSKKQKLAVIVLQHFQENNVPFEVLLKVREIIVWIDDPCTTFEYRLLDSCDMETRNIIRNMR